MLFWTSKDIAPASDPWTLDQGIIYIKTTGSLIAVNPQDGLVLWQEPIADVTIVGSPSQTGTLIIAGPFVQNNQVYAITNSGGVVALHTSDGSPAWTHQLEQFDFNQFYTNLYPDGLFLIAPNTSTIDAWQSISGKYLWHYTASAPILWEPRTDAGIIFIRKLDGTMDVLNINTGRVLWRYLL